MRGAEGGAPGLLRLEVAPSERARLAQRGACHRDIPAQGRGSEHLRRAQDARAAALAHGAESRARVKRPSVDQRASKRESPDDLVKRRFEAGGPNAAWFADIAYVKTRQGWLYLALVMDIWSRRIVGWSMGPDITAELADEALKMALGRRNNPRGYVHHSDHGSQYVSLLPSKTMREHGVRPSMGSISSPWDNAAMESLMGIVKSKCVHART